jgi:ectoine hydroxylase-related dioxygenase (phytanoyl-CoA dioxygenase family)
VANINNDLEKSEGYQVRNVISSSELEKLKAIIEKKWRHCINAYYEDRSSKKNHHTKIECYHENIDDSDHQDLWPKKNRMLNVSEVETFMNMKFFKDLKNILGLFCISDEESLGYENIYWRIVRPHKPSDVGPAHRDEWFWRLNKKYVMPDQKKRVKIWIPLITEQKRSGLLMEKYSHKRADIEWSGELRHGINKPVLITPDEQLNLELVDTKEGDLIIFHDKMLHGGKINTGTKTRVSIEFTALVEEKE